MSDRAEGSRPCRDAGRPLAYTHSRPLYLSYNVMPTYEYRCPEGHDFEKFFRTISSAAATLPCPKCGAEAERQLSGGAGLMFKGSGFYLTDYGKNAHKAKPPAKAEAKGDTGAKGESAPASEKSTPSESAKPAAKKPAE